MKERGKLKEVLHFLSSYVVFFSLVAFVITCSTMLFTTILSDSLNVVLTEENLGKAAKLTFINAAVIALLFTVVDAVRRKLTVERPARDICNAAEALMGGDFSARVQVSGKFGSDGTLGEVAECFNKMAQELSGVETLRSDFISVVSHEMKTPLAVMHNYATLLCSPDITEEERVQYAHGMRESCDKLADMVTNILRLNRLEHQSIYPVGAPYDLSEQLCECVLSFESVWESAGVELECDIEDNVRVCADSELLSHVWNNLLSNAFKFTDRGGKVSVSLRSDGEWVTVTVSDTGCGISAEVGERIFEKFYQADSSRSTHGNGLGLSLVRRIIDIIDAEISVESKVGCGSSFCVRLRRNMQDER